MIKLPSDVSPDNLINDLRSFSWEASEILLYYAQILKNSNNKSKILKNNNSEDPVTLADLKVNQLIIQRIIENYRDVDWEILSEENAKLKNNNCNLNKSWIWVLDPLDGTKDFIQGTNNYAVHLALNYKKKPYLGIVLIPELEELWIAIGEKVWCERRDKSFKYFQTSKNKILEEMVIVTSKNHRNNVLKELIEKVGFKKVITMGSIGCKIASILRGESDIYICLSLPGTSSPKDWDFSAPEAILKAAGGQITNINNEPLEYGKTNFEHQGIIVASRNLSVHGRICLEIKEIIKKNSLFPL